MQKYWEFSDFLSQDQDWGQDFDFFVLEALRDKDFVLEDNITEQKYYKRKNNFCDST